MTLNPSELCQIEIQVNNLEDSLRFYKNVFGWNPVPAEIHRVTVLEVPKYCPFGISLVPYRHDNSRQKGRIILYFPTSKPEEILAKAEENGGKSRFGPKKLHGYGEIFQIEDPDGIRWGLIRHLRPQQ